MADKTDIIDAIEALSIHCRPAIMDPESRSLWLKDWCADLAEFPLDAIQAACRKWRQSGATKFPTAGQLLPMVRDALPVEKTRCVETWSPASDAEFRSMSVREKIRELSILAHQERTKAGPMFKNTSQGLRMSGVHLMLDEMPLSYRMHTAEAERYEAEIGKLREVLRTPYQGESR